MVDRLIPPTFQPIQDISFPWPETKQLSNHLPMHVLNVGSHPIIEIDLVFQAGDYYEAFPGAAYFTAAMLQEGTHNKHANEIAALVDYYGASIRARAQSDFCFVSLTMLSKHLCPMLALFIEILLDPIFPAKPLEVLKNLKKQSIQMADKKPTHVAYKRLCSVLFPQKHPYGRSLTLQDVEKIEPSLLRTHYKRSFFTNGKAFVSGQILPIDLQHISDALSRLPLQAPLSMVHDNIESIPEKMHVAHTHNMQSAIVIGKKLLTKTEADFLPMVIVNELLGGYFGSRLMQSLREEKGYTYGIHSNMVALQEAGYFTIVTEVAQDVAQDALRDIYREIARLQEELVALEELEQVKNYLLGHFLTTINEPFSMMKKFQSAYLYGLNQTYYERWYNQVRDVTPLDVRNLAQKYLSLDSLTEVVVG